MIKLSPSSGLNLFNDCPKCFWLHHRQNLKRPSGPFPSLPGGMDNVIKKYFDKYRGKKDGLPPEIKGEVKGVLMPDLELMNKWRDWRTGPQYKDKETGAVLFGALDDCVIDGDEYVVLDYKTRGYPPGSLEDSQRYYGTQMDAYALMLWANGYKVARHAYLVYFFPRDVKKGGVVNFNIEVKKIEVSPKRVQRLFVEAVRCLEGPQPAHHTGCPFCNWQKMVAEFD
ncbi:PD-(D/E)XK nuclease family protein [Candidatus Parcubacteria bacterium]|nr:PD-(D/E)XK nuclease family protein [Candidatus Parcubacteria bacterium]